MTDYRVRVCVIHEGSKYFFLRFAGNGWPEFVPGERIHQSPLMSRDFAIVLARKLNANGCSTQPPLRAHIITPENVILYDEATAPPQQAPKSAERVPMQCNGILLTPGQTKGYYVKFPGSPFESIYGDTAEAAYQKLIENPRAEILIPLAEKYNAPPEPPALEPIPYRTRPGDQRR